jgi:hypothetical protein
MARIPIADVTALNYLNPIYVMLLAVVLLKERLGPWRIGAVVVAFLGTLVIVRPGFREIDIGHLAMLFTAVFMAGSYFMAKLLSDRARPEVVVFMLSVVVPAVLLPYALAVWVPIGWRELGWLSLTAMFATAGHYTMTLAFTKAPLTVTQPVTFLQLIWATLSGCHDLWGGGGCLRDAGRRDDHRGHQRRDMARGAAQKGDHAAAGCTRDLSSRFSFRPQIVQSSTVPHMGGSKRVAAARHRALCHFS